MTSMAMALANSSASAQSATAHEILHVEPWDELPIIMFSPDPEPHTAIGSCLTDYIKPLQLAKSQIMRDTLDSLGHAVFPRMGIVTKARSILTTCSTLMSASQSACARLARCSHLLCRLSASKPFRSFNTWTNQREDRTGVSKAIVGLNAESMQSTTAAAINNTISNAQGRIEVMARNLAETGMKPLMRLLTIWSLSTMNRRDVLRLRNQFVPVDPRFWDTNKDIVVNVALAASDDRAKIASCNRCCRQQEGIIQQLGFANPLVSPQQYMNTTSKMVELSGFKDVDNYHHHPSAAARSVCHPTRRRSLTRQ